MISNSSDTQGNIQSTFVHNRDIFLVTLRILANRLLLLLSLYDDDSDLRYRIRHDDFQLDHQCRYCYRDNGTARLAAPFDGGCILQSPVKHYIDIIYILYDESINIVYQIFLIFIELCRATWRTLNICRCSITLPKLYQ